MDGTTSLGVIVAIVGAGAGFFFAAALLVRDRTGSPETLYLAVASLVSALSFSDDAAEASLAYARFPAAYGFGYLLPPLLGPLVYLHIAARANPVGAGWPRAWPHLLGVSILWVALTPYLLLGTDRWAYYVGEKVEGPEIFMAAVGLLLLVALGIVQMTVYLVWSWRRTAGVVDPASRRWVRGLVATAAVSYAGYVVGVAGDVTELTSRGTLIITNIVFVASIYGFALFALSAPRPRDTTAPTAADADRGRKYARSALDDADVERLVGKATALVAQRGIHRDPTLTLAKLAAAAGVSPNDMSQALNQRAEGFHEWLAAARIADVQASFRADPDAPTLDAAYAAGFNAKSTFYEAFRRATGMTPAAWRAKLAAVDEPSSRARSDADGGRWAEA